MYKLRVKTATFTIRLGVYSSFGMAGCHSIKTLSDLTEFVVPGCCCVLPTVRSTMSKKSL